MVRIKNRWLLINIHFDDVRSSSGGGGGGGPSASNSLVSSPAPAGTATPTPMQLVLLRAIRDTIQTAFGDVGAGALGGALAVRYYSPSTHNAIVRCSRIGVKHVWAAITLCDRLDGRRARMIVSHCGGTIKKVQQAAIRADRRAIERACMQRKRLHNPSTPVVLDDEAQRALAESKRAISAVEH